MEQRALRIGAAALVFALLLRLAGNWETGVRELGSALLFFSTGRLAAGEPAAPEPEETEPDREPAGEEVRTPESPEAAPVFGPRQAPLVQINGEWAVDTQALLEQPLQWQLKGQAPTVLILHTHATESYENAGTYRQTSPYRTLDTAYNMISVGDRLAELLEAGGITVIHDRTLHDYPSYNSAYQNARATLQTHLEATPSLCLVLDLHRDAREDGEGNQKGETVQINGRQTARLMLVMGSDKGSLPYPNWERNLALAVKLQAQLEADYPGLCRPVKLAASRYNQDLCDGALLVEVGAAGNTHDQALAAAELLAQGILALANGANV